MTTIPCIIIAVITLILAAKLRKEPTGSHFKAVRGIRTAQAVLLSTSVIEFAVGVVLTVIFIASVLDLNKNLEIYGYSAYHDYEIYSESDLDAFNTMATAVYIYTGLGLVAVILSIMAVVKSGKAITRFAVINPYFGAQPVQSMAQGVVIPGGQFIPQQNGYYPSGNYNVQNQQNGYAQPGMGIPAKQITPANQPAPPVERKCRACGARLDPGDRFCQNCGANQNVE